MTQVTDAQLVALAERLGFTFRYDDMLIAPPGSDDPSDLRPVTHLLTWEGFGLVQAAMAGLGYSLLLLCRPGENARAEFSGEAEQIYYYGESPEAPDAIVLAACAALGVTG